MAWNTEIGVRPEAIRDRGTGRRSAATGVPDTERERQIGRRRLIHQLEERRAWADLHARLGGLL